MYVNTFNFKINTYVCVGIQHGSKLLYYIPKPMDASMVGYTYSSDGIIKASTKKHYKIIKR